MKRKYFMFSFIFLFILMTNVSAETYYGNYFITNEDISTYPFDEVLIKEKKLFNTYKEEYKDLGYLFDNDIYIKDENDFIEELVLNDDYKENTVQYIEIGTNNINNTNIIQLKNLFFNTKIYGIEVFYDDELIDVNYSGEHLINIGYLYDKDLNTNITCISASNMCVLKILFNDFYDLDKLKIVIYSNDNISANIYYDNNFKESISLKNKKHILNFNTKLSGVKYKYGEFIKKYKYYEFAKVPINNYVESSENIILDDVKIEYINYIRDKLVIKKDIIINNKNTDIEDFIEYSSGEVITNCNIDYNINGEYICNFKLNDININKKVIVDIVEDNIIEEDNVIENKEENINNEIIDLSNDSVIDESIADIKGNIIIGDTVDYAELVEKKYKENNSVRLNILKYIIILLMISIEIILFIRKKKIKSNVENI